MKWFKAASRLSANEMREGERVDVSTYPDSCALALIKGCTFGSDSVDGF